MLNITIWYDVLFQVNKLSPLLTSSDATIDIMIAKIYATCSFFQDYSENCYTSDMMSGRDIAEGNSIVLRSKARRKIKNKFI